MRVLLRTFLLVVSCAFACGVAGADTFTFTAPLETGNVTGTLTGTVVIDHSIVDGSTIGPATSLTLTSYPAGFGTLLGGTTPSAWQYVYSDFAFVNGQVSSYYFYASTTSHAFAIPGMPTPDSDTLCLNDGSTVLVNTIACRGNFLDVVTAGNLSYGQTIFVSETTNTFTLLLAAAPEPSGLALLGTGVLGMGIAVRRRFVG